MYDHPNRRTYTHFFDFGGGADENISLFGPKGKEGRLYDYGVYGIIEVFNGDTLDPKMKVGSASDDDAYGTAFSLTTALAPDNHGVSVRNLYEPLSAAFIALILPATEIPADGEVVMGLVASTGANLTGQATAFVVIDWQF